MPGEFRAEVYQNEYLPAGGREVHAILSVAAGEGTLHTGGERVFGMLCDVSGSMQGEKIEAARAAMLRVIELLPPECSFFVVTGADGAQLACPLVRADAAGKQQGMFAVRSIHAFGGTRISNWLHLAMDQFRLRPGVLCQALLLTDGQNDSTDAPALDSVLGQAQGVFQCDCRGVGTDWRVDQLRAVAERLLGSVELIAAAGGIETDFRNLLTAALAKTMTGVSLRLWTPQGTAVRFVKQVSPQLMDLSARARDLGPQLREYPTGAWSRNETREYHLCLEVQPGAVGDEVLAGRVSLVATERGVERRLAEGRILAIWTDDYARSTRLHRAVAHYTGQAELAESIQGGLEAQASGDTERATQLLGRAVALAHQSGNAETARLLGRVVEVDDAARGTVRLRAGAGKEDAMALDTRSTRTTRIPKST